MLLEDPAVIPFFPIRQARHLIIPSDGIVMRNAGKEGVGSDSPLVKKTGASSFDKSFQNRVGAILQNRRWFLVVPHFIPIDPGKHMI
ncbi:MAG: hypothetical protein FIA93_01295 [Deltaproteobacteria bacterium]|nr:hypothetical protein [Deltaproteobacteria bacterium]